MFVLETNDQDLDTGDPIKFLLTGPMVGSKGI